MIFWISLSLGVVELNDTIAANVFDAMQYPLDGTCPWGLIYVGY
jgi:hypothetical protein